MSDPSLANAEEIPRADPVRLSGLHRSDALAVFGLALGLRVWHLLALRRSPFFEVLMGDSLAYDEWARRIAGGDCRRCRTLPLRHHLQCYRYECRENLDPLNSNFRQGHPKRWPHRYSNPKAQYLSAHRFGC